MPDAEHKTTLAIPVFSTTETDLTTADAELWWPRFSLFIDMTQDIDIDKYINGSLTITDDQAAKVKKFLIWGIGQKAIHAMTRRLHNEPLTDMSIKRIHEIFRNRFMSEKNTQQNRNDFFELQPRESETPEQTWERLLDVERKCKFEKITAEELIIAKFRSLIKEKELKEKLEKATQKIADFVKI